MKDTDSFILALPKGRVYEDFIPTLQKTKFALRDDPKKSRKMLLDTEHPEVKVLLSWSSMHIYKLHVQMYVMHL